jgi:alpha-tubulin suppressor-like RCC1 family protein
MKAHVRLVIAVLALVVAGAVTARAVSALPVAAMPSSAATVVAPAVAGAVASVTPTRIADSRAGLQIPGAVAGFGTVGVQVAGRGGIPGSGAAAVLATVTVAGPQGGGYLTVWPSGTAMPGTSNLNFQTGQTIANTVIVRLGADGWIQLFNGSYGTAQVIVDVTGYTQAGSTSVPGAMEIPDNPQRLADSRIGLQIHGPVPAIGTVAVQAVPGPVGEVMLTVTVVDPQDAGYITVWPGYGTRPDTSNLNFQAGRTIATTVIVPASDNGVIELFNGSFGSVHVIVDISGFTLAGTPTAAGTIGPVTARIADSRLGLQIPGAVTALGSVAVQVASPGSGVAAAMATVTVVDPPAGGYVTVWRSGTRLPGTSNLNFQAGQTIATTVIVPIGRDGKIQLFNGSPGAVQLIVAITGSTLTDAGVHDAVWAWGGADNGQLGNGSTTNSVVPVPVFGLDDVTVVAGGWFAGYALRSDGTVWSWGTGAFGQRGTGGCCAIVSPVPLQIPGLSDVTAIAGGYGTGYALRSDGTVWSWGDGQSGALGDGNDESYSTVPVQVSGLEHLHITAIAAGIVTGYALTSDGFVWAWGAGNVGQLGNGGTTNSLAAQVSQLSHVTAIAAGGSTGYAVLGNDTVWAWGDGSWGQLGDGRGGPSSRSLEPVQVPGLTGVTALAAATFTGYALRGDGSVAAWGEGHYGQLGNNTTTTISAGPVQVSVPTGLTAIAAGGLNGYALRDGTAWAWGQGYLGQLGNGATADGLLPATVPGLTGVIAVAGGGYTGYAITN